MKFPGVYSNKSGKTVVIRNIRKIKGPQIIIFSSSGLNIVIPSGRSYECNLCFDAPPLPGKYSIEVGTFNDEDI